MATRPDPLPTWFARVLSTYSLHVYAVGLVVIVASRLVEGNLEIPFPRQLRQAIVVVTLAVMVVTYLAERRFARGRSGGGEDTGDGDRPGDGDDAGTNGADGAPEHSLYARVSMALAAVGVAVGIYVAVALERLLVGGLFILGAYLFVHMAYRHEGDGGDH